MIREMLLAVAAALYVLIETMLIRLAITGSITAELPPDDLEQLEIDSFN